MNDRTAKIEQTIKAESKPKVRHVTALWLYVFRSTKLVSVIYLVAVLSLAFLRPALAFIWQRYLDAVQLASVQGVTASILLIVAYFLIMTITETISNYAEGWEDIERLDVIQTNRIQELMQTKMFRKLSHISPEFMEVSKINDNVQQVFQYVGERYSGVSTGLIRQGFQLIGYAASVISVAVSLYVFNPWLTLLILLAPLPTLWSGLVGQKKSFQFNKANQEVLRKMNVYQNYMASTSVKELLTLGLYDFVFDKWKTLADKYTHDRQKMLLSQVGLSLFQSLLNTIVNAGGQVAAIVLMAMGQISLAALGAVMTLVGTLSSSTSQFIRCLSSALSQKNQGAQFHDFITLPEEDVQTSSSDSITFANVRYRYPMTDKYALDGVNVTIRKGERVALVGENGAGKTTFVKLITGMLTPSDGSVAAPTEFSAVTQSPAKYESFTVGDNVFLGDTSRERSEPEIDSALNFAGLSDLDKDTYLGKTIGGTDISGGQWQKLAIARAAYRNRDCIILDEPTGNLDPLAEAEVFKRYIELSGDKTVVFVTHRISVAALADRIIVFDGGRIVQDGTHEQVSGHGEFARLYAEQAKWYDR
jgi:ATP-binding cassette subfamily B protein